MNEKSDELTKQPPKPSQPEAQEQPEYWDVSPDELKQILEAHKKWLDSGGKEGKQADLMKANLEKADLRLANLQEALLLGVNLQKANLRDANLKKANLLGADLQEADLREAKLDGAKLMKAKLQEASLGEASLLGAEIGGACLKGTDLNQADLEGANLVEVKGLSEATLHNTNLDKVTGLLGSEFARADVTGTKLPEDIRDFKVLQVVEETSKTPARFFSRCCWLVSIRG